MLQFKNGLMFQSVGISCACDRCLWSFADIYQKISAILAIAFKQT
ncbi:MULTISPECIES: hypothetical protein [Nostocaceae]|nr:MULTISPECIES: hypothetical protein [Nostocaceae]